MQLFMAAESWPFLLAVVLLIAITAIEGLGMLAGFSSSGWLDQMLPDYHGDLEGISDSWLGWLHLGKIPLLVVLVLLLTAFAISGYLINAIAHWVFSAYLPAPLASLIALLCALPVVRTSAATITHLIPRDETWAEPLDALVGQVATITNGTARHGIPAQAKVRNKHGFVMYIHAEPDYPDAEFVSGDSVLLVKQLSGTRFLAITNPRPDLL